MEPFRDSDFQHPETAAAATASSSSPQAGRKGEGKNKNNGVGKKSKVATPETTPVPPAKPSVKKDKRVTKVKSVVVANRPLPPPPAFDRPIIVVTNRTDSDSWTGPGPVLAAAPAAGSASVGVSADRRPGADRRRIPSPVIVGARPSRRCRRRGRTRSQNLRQKAEPKGHCSGSDQARALGTR